MAELNMPCLRQRAIVKFLVSLMSRLGNRSVRVSDFYLQKLRFSALCESNEQKFCILLTWPKTISRPKKFPNLSTDGQENATFSQKVTNPHASIPSSGDQWSCSCSGCSGKLLQSSVKHFCQVLGMAGWNIPPKCNFGLGSGTFWD